MPIQNGRMKCGLLRNNQKYDKGLVMNYFTCWRNVGVAFGRTYPTNG